MLPASIGKVFGVPSQRRQLAWPDAGAWLVIDEPAWALMGHVAPAPTRQHAGRPPAIAKDTTGIAASADRWSISPTQIERIPNPFS